MCGCLCDIFGVCGVCVCVTLCVVCVVFVCGVCICVWLFVWCVCDVCMCMCVVHVVWRKSGM